MTNQYLYQVGEDGSDTDWNMTVRLPEGLPEDFDYSEPVNAVGGKEKCRAVAQTMCKGNNHKHNMCDCN